MMYDEGILVSIFKANEIAFFPFKKMKRKRADFPHDGPLFISVFQ